MAVFSTPFKSGWPKIPIPDHLNRSLKKSKEETSNVHLLKIPTIKTTDIKLKTYNGIIRKNLPTKKDFQGYLSPLKFNNLLINKKLEIIKKMATLDCPKWFIRMEFGSVQLPDFRYPYQMLVWWINTDMAKNPRNPSKDSYRWFEDFNWYLRLIK